MKHVMRVLVVLWLVVGFSACRREGPTSTPEGTYRGFVDALQKGNARKAWSALSKETRARVEARSKELAAASKGTVRDEPQLLLFEGSRPTAIEAITPVREDESSAVLRVTSGGGTREVKLLKDSGRWVIDLSDSLEGSNSP